MREKIEMFPGGIEEGYAAFSISEVRELENKLDMAIELLDERDKLTKTTPMGYYLWGNKYREFLLKLKDQEV